MRALVRTAFAVLALIAAAAPAAAGDAGDVPLVDQRGLAFTLHALRGAPVAVTFVASRCTDTCPIANAVFARAQSELERTHARAHLVSVTIDPVYDTPFVLAGLAHRYAADARRWRLASGSTANVERLLGAFGVQHDAADAHGTLVYVLDGRGRLARTLLLSADGAAAIVATLAAS